MRKTLQILFVLSFCVTMISCNTPKHDGSDTSLNFTSFWVSFVKAFNEKKTNEINKYINSKYGFFVIDNPGAYTVVYRFDSFNEFAIRSGDFSIEYDKILNVDCKLTDGKRPYYDCEKGWDKEGCFLEKTPEFKLYELYESMVEYFLVDSNSVKEEMELVTDFDTMNTRLVYSTDKAVGFYFGEIDGKWYLLCIDEVTPCSA